MAALKEGDRNGVKLPLMDNFVDILGLSGLLSEARLDFESMNFEDVYTKIHSAPNLGSLCRKIEEIVYRYFLDP